MTEAYFAAFQAISGDNHPIHYDLEYCRARGYPGLLTHGFQVLAFSAVGAGSFPHAIGDSLIGFIEQSSKFLKPVFAGDTLYPTLTISALLPQKTTGVVVMEATLHNQRPELVMTGDHKYLLRL
jgi:acyl dehydratase